ncbi:dystroglycan-related [Anaeramoeba flamelloides]|uniref:Dystroglycan-related n=1 Tax=Anaeramoeba flamelloides TaxID=1746091 RepID=A0ABQ8XBV5_9EUKA|nr:dystroglycan-related [Anaeramoeba flamelloides]
MKSAVVLFQIVLTVAIVFGLVSAGCTPERYKNEFLASQNTTSKDRSPSGVSFSDGTFGVIWSDCGIFVQKFNIDGEAMGTTQQANDSPMDCLEDETPKIGVVNSKIFQDLETFIVVWRRVYEGNTIGVYFRIYDSDLNSKTNVIELVAADFAEQNFSKPSIEVIASDRVVVGWSSTVMGDLGSRGTRSNSYASIIQSDGTIPVSKTQINEESDATNMVSSSGCAVTYCNVSSKVLFVWRWWDLQVNISSTDRVVIRTFDSQLSGGSSVITLDSSEGGRSPSIETSKNLDQHAISYSKIEDENETEVAFSLNLIIVDSLGQVLKGPIVIMDETVEDDPLSSLATLVAPPGDDDPYDKLVVVWNAPDRTLSGVYFQIFYWEDLSPLCDESLVNSFTLSNQFDPSVSNLPEQNTQAVMIILFCSKDQFETGSINVYAQRYELTTGIGPYVNNPLEDQSKGIQQKIEYIFDPNTFYDENGKLSYEAFVNEEDPLPQWLDFNSDQRNFSGVYSSGCSATYDITLQCQDTCKLKNSTTFTLTINNQVPYINNPLINQYLSAGEYLEYTFANNTFSDLENEELSYSWNNNSGPAWLNFIPEQRLFYGTPYGCRNSWNVQVSANDSCSTNLVTATFELHLINNRPVLNNSLQNLVLTENQFFLVDYSQVFDDPENEILDFTIQSRDGEALPDWIKINQQNHTIYGITPGEDSFVDIGIVVTDSCKENEASDFFNIIVNEQIDTISFSKKIHLNLGLIIFLFSFYFFIYFGK